MVQSQSENEETQRVTLDVPGEINQHAEESDQDRPPSRPRSAKKLPAELEELRHQLRLDVQETVRDELRRWMRQTNQSISSGGHSPRLSPRPSSKERTAVVGHNTPPFKQRKGHIQSHMAKLEARYGDDDDEEGLEGFLPFFRKFNSERGSKKLYRSSTANSLVRKSDSTPGTALRHAGQGSGSIRDSRTGIEPSTYSADSTEEGATTASSKSPSNLYEYPSQETDVDKVKSRAALDRVREDISLFDWCMGMVGPKEHLEGAASALRKRAHRLLRHPVFDCIILLFISMNTVTVGIQTNIIAKGNSDLCDYPPLREVEVTFCAIFLLELVLRLYVYRAQFFYMLGCAWNIFDLIVVCVGVVEEILMEIAVRSNTSLGCQNSSGTLLRIVRVLRATRVFRIIRVMRFTQELRLLVSCVVISARSFLWALMLIAMLVYIISVYIVQIVTLHREKSTNEADNAELVYWFGTVPRCCLSLFEAFTGGVDWDALARPLGEKVSYWLQLFFMMYIAFFVLVVMNVVTGMFVETAIDRANYVKTMDRIHQARRLFKSLDLNCDGNVSFNEIAEQLNDIDNHEFRNYFKQIDVDPSEAGYLFDMLDINDSGAIDLEEFLSGCLRMQGPAKALDLLLMTRESRRNDDRVDRSLRNQEKQFEKVFEVLEKMAPHDPSLEEAKAASRRSRSRSSTVASAAPKSPTNRSLTCDASWSLRANLGVPTIVTNVPSISAESNRQPST